MAVIAVTVQSIIIDTYTNIHEIVGVCRDEFRFIVHIQYNEQKCGRLFTKCLCALGQWHS